MLRRFNEHPYDEHYNEINLGAISRIVDVDGRRVNLLVRSFIYYVFLNTIFEFNLF
jgi:hypothetical protein